MFCMTFAASLAISIADGSFQNTLMSIDFKSDENNLTAILNTKLSYTKEINAVKTGANTYVITLPEIDNELNTSSVANPLIESVNVRTMPFSQTGNGYTKITIKTNTNMPLITQTQVYKSTVQNVSPQRVVEKPETSLENNFSKNDIIPPQSSSTNDAVQYSSGNQSRSENYNQSTSYKEYESRGVKSVPKKSESVSESTEVSTPTERNKVNNTVSSDKQDLDMNSAFPYVIGIILLFVFSLIMFLTGKRKMKEVLGESSEYDFSDDEDSSNDKKEKKRNKKEIRNTIAKLDKKYSTSSALNIITGDIKKEENTDIAEEQTSEKDKDNDNDNDEDENTTIIVDLDKLYAEKTNQLENKNTEEAIDNNLINEEQEEEKDDLADFLNDFSFESEISEDAENQEREETLYNEELFDRVINSKSILFSQDDLQKINKLMSSEITDETLDNVNKYMSDPARPKKLTKQQILEDLVTTYSIERDISFSQKDIEILNKLISVEIDSDFVTNLRTNTDYIRKKEEEIKNANSGEWKKPSEVKLLNVKEVLPDLSEELKKLGNKKIESEYKPETVYYSEGYEVSKFTPTEELANLKIDKNSKENDYRPSDSINLAEEGYEVQTLTIKEELPDLQDAKANPKKYENIKKSAPVEIDEEALIRNIANVTFKPFYDGTEDYISYEDEIEDEEAPILSQQEIKEEFKQFEDFEIVEEEINNEPNINDEPQNGNIDDEVIHVLEKDGTVKSERRNQTRKHGLEYIKQVNEDAKKLLDLIEEKKAGRKDKKELLLLEKAEKEKDTSADNKSVLFGKCVINNEEYKIVSSCELSQTSGFYLGQNAKGYLIIGYINDDIFALKHYEELSTTNIQARNSGRVDESASQYIVKIGKNKFILNISEDKMEFVMEL